MFKKTYVFRTTINIKRKYNLIFMGVEERKLYEDSQIIIEYFQNSFEDHFVSIKKAKSGFLLQHGVLEGLARINRDRFKSSLNAVCPSIDYLCEVGEVSVDALDSAIAKAYIETQRRSEVEMRKNLSGVVGDI
ncbi:MAG: hypothetical protein Q7S56_04035 [Nanoarchaeota archaeon]|nr:hypothetical protein [Nanoarchaeota archaeon]